MRTLLFLCPLFGRDFLDFVARLVCSHIMFNTRNLVDCLPSYLFYKFCLVDGISNRIH